MDSGVQADMGGLTMQYITKTTDDHTVHVM